MKDKEKPKMIACPECFEDLPEEDLRAQVIHMQRHPEVTVRHLDELGFYKAAEKFLREYKKQKLEN